MGTTDTFDSPNATIVLNTDTIPTKSTTTGLAATATLAQIAGVTAGVIDTTATILTVTATAHAGKVITLSNATPIKATLPQATGTGNVYRFIIQVAATATTSSICVANTTDVMQGIQLVMTTSSANVIGFHTSATSDTIQLNGSTLGGVAGAEYTITDIKTGFFQVVGIDYSTGSTATPFLANV